jgi:hypothetical protein
MPKALLDFMGYSFFFWSNENNEPIHIHVSKGRPSEISSKFWIGREVIMEHNKAQIKRNDLRRIKAYIEANKNDIIASWVHHFGVGM